MTANPEIFHLECDEDDFLLLVCDGVSEGDFPNPEVVKFVAGMMKEGKEIGEAATAVLHKAVEMNSKDNITCMVVLLKSGTPEVYESHDFTPGPITNLGNKTFRTAYTQMASRAHPPLTLAEAASKRYDVIIKELQKNEKEEKEEEVILAGTADLREEAEKVGKPAGESDSAERIKWFEEWLEKLPEEKESGPGGMDMDSLSEMMGKGGGKGAGMGAPGGAGAKGAGKAAGKGKDMISDNEEVELNEDGYVWSQKGEEVSITFKLPQTATKKDVKVAFKPSAMTVTVHGSSLMDGKLGGQVDTDDCTWCLANGGSELQVMLTKNNGGTANWPGLLK